VPTRPLSCLDGRRPAAPPTPAAPLSPPSQADGSAPLPGLRVAHLISGVASLGGEPVKSVRLAAVAVAAAAAADDGGAAPGPLLPLAGVATALSRPFVVRVRGACAPAPS
jgi:hypothetical protein